MTTLVNEEEPIGSYELKFIFKVAFTSTDYKQVAISRLRDGVDEITIKI